MPLSSRQRQTLLWTGIAAAFVWALVVLGPVLTPFVAAAILAYMLAPLVDSMHARRVPRVLATLMAIVLAILALASLVLILVPIVQKEFGLIRSGLPGLVASITSGIQPWLERQFGITLQLDTAAIRNWLTEQLADSGQDIAAMAFGYAKSGWAAVLQIAGTVFLVPVVLFYLLNDWPVLVARVRTLVPTRWMPEIDALLGETDTLLGQYLRGQMLLMLALAAWYSAALLVAGFELWLPIGVLSGLLVFVPYIGFATGLCFAAIAGMLQLGPVAGIASVAIVYGIGQVLESVWLTPKLVGERIGLHPVAVIFALLAFGATLGFIGVLLALPLAAIVAVGLRRLRRAWLDSEFFEQQVDR
jgi:predicted PurR-regulated permease PerM